MAGYAPPCFFSLFFVFVHESSRASAETFAVHWIIEYTSTESLIKWFNEALAIYDVRNYNHRGCYATHQEPQEPGLERQI